MIRLASLIAAIFLGLVLLNTASVSQEQPGTGAGKKVKGQLPPGWKKLNLSTQQKTKIYQIQSDYRVKIKALDEQIKQLKNQELGDMVKVLTDKQRAELTKGLVPETSTDKKPDDKK